MVFEKLRVQEDLRHYGINTTENSHSYTSKFTNLQKEWHVYATLL